MVNGAWHKRLAAWRNRLYLYPSPDPLPHTRAFWLATGLVTLLVVLFAGYFILYLTGLQDAYLTNAEDLGMMDQAIWSTLHGHMLHQTICNIVSDTNCYNSAGISRLAIHFEPILLPVSLLYLIWPSPKTLQIIQTLVVTSGAYPAFWLARLRLRSEWAGVAIALLYLLYPAQQNALIFDFHAVTFTSSLLLFALYFMYTRRTAWLFTCALLAMACKEEIPLVVACFGLWSMLLQRRWRSGLLLVLLTLAWIVVGLLVVHFFSPFGHSLLLSRFSYLGGNPLQIAHTLLVHPVGTFKQHVLERSHFTYLSSLFAPAGYLPLLAPWVLVLALPTLMLNLLSTDPGMYSGIFQYNAEIVPILIFATIEAVVLILWLLRWFYQIRRDSIYRVQEEGGGPLIGADVRARATARGAPTIHGIGKPIRRIVGAGLAPALEHRPPFLKSAPMKGPLTGRFFGRRLIVFGLMLLLVVYILASVLNEDTYRSGMPLAHGFHWPQITAHVALAQHFIDMIPPTASVSAQSKLVPHISQRLNIYMFPYADTQAEYILLDLRGDKYPYAFAQAYKSEVNKVLQSGNYGILAAQDGYLLLKHGLAPPLRWHPLWSAVGCTACDCTTHSTPQPCEAPWAL